MASILFCTESRLGSRGTCLASWVLLASCLTSLLVLILSWLYRRLSQTHDNFGLFKISKHEADPTPSQTARYITQVSPQLAILEVIAVLVDGVACTGILFLHHHSDPQGGKTGFAFLLSSAYLLFLLAWRSSGLTLSLQWHSICLYAVHWIVAAGFIHQLAAHHFEWVESAVGIARLAIYTALCTIHGIAPRKPTQAHWCSSKGLLRPGGDETASLFSRLTFFWINGLVWKAFRRPLEYLNLPPLGVLYASETTVSSFQASAAPTMPLLWRLLRFIKYDYMLQSTWAALASIVVYVPPMLMRVILQYLESQHKLSEYTAWTCVAGLLLSGLLAGVFDCQCNWTGRKIGIKLRSILMHEIYSKILCRSITRKQSVEETSTKPENETQTNSEGNTLNLISVDVDLVSGMSENLYMIWVIFPVQTAIGTYLLFKILGISGVLGVLLMMVLLPLNLLVSKRVMAAQGHVLAASDKRIHSTNELFHNIRTVKYCAWEVPFKEMMLASRDSELTRLWTRFVWWSISMTLFHALPFIVTIATCFLYTIVWHKELGTSIAFPALAIFTVLRIPINRLADSITFALQAHVSLQRISAFLDERDTSKDFQLSRGSDSYIGFNNATFSWPTSTRTTNDEGTDGIPLGEVVSPTPFRLQGITINFFRHGLNTVCGPSGSGKSSLLLALLGEMDLIKGRVSLPRDDEPFSEKLARSLSATSAYCSQEPWIMNRSIRENILMGLPFESRRYEEALCATALTQDLATLQQRDKTLAGENGNRLSGGQKQRVSLARALYSYSKYVILDDSLSALDSHTANHIFFKAIRGPLMRKRTCILATHNEKLALPYSDHITMLESGRVKAQGATQMLVSTGLISKEHLRREQEIQLADAGGEKLSAHGNSNPHSIEPCSAKSEARNMDSQMERGETLGDYKESKSEGAVPWPVIGAYLKAMGSSGYWLALFSGFAIQQVASLGTSLWIKEWAFQYDKIRLDLELDSDSTSTDARGARQVSATYYLAVYCTICLAYALITFLRDLLTFYGSLKASRGIFVKLLDSVLYAKLQFFDRTPLGQITNRFSRDIEILDQAIATFSISLFQLAATLVATAILISVYLPAFLLVAIVISLAYYAVTGVYISSARDLKRIEAVQRSPLYQLFGETSSGCVTIRAYAKSSSFSAESQSLVDRLNEPCLLQSATKEWLTLRVSVLSSLIAFATGSFILWNIEVIDPGAAALALTMASSVTENVIWLVQIYAIIQQNLNSVERIFEYSDEIEREPSAPLTAPSQSIPYNWPSRGHVQFKNYTARYAPELDPALSDISFDASPGERVAIVGRTGAGKSTLALALIRALEADSSGRRASESSADDTAHPQCVGRIEIDGIDVASVTLQQLRQAVTIVPQDPKLFGGSLRDNLSPMRLHADDEIVEALRAAGLAPGAGPGAAGYGDLDRAAESLSRGQRQLLCIARGVLRRSRVLVLDEATASVDHAADAATQAGLRASAAAGTTVLAIAHRLRSVADYDRVVVLDGGRVLEQGTPRALLARRAGRSPFRRLCEESGDMAEIERIARGGQGDS